MQSSENSPGPDERLPPVRFILEIETGTFAGRKIQLPKAQRFLIGRNEGADFVIPYDRMMSGLHFSVECDESGCRLRDQGSTNGTFINGIRTGQGVLHDNDKVRAGNTEFVVHFERELPAAARTENHSHEIREERERRKTMSGTDLQAVFGKWSLSFVPSGWEIIESVGIRDARDGVFPSNVVIVEDELPPGMTLQDYVDKQLPLLRERLDKPEIEGPSKADIAGVEETLEFILRHMMQNTPLIQRQIYARHFQSVGVITLTTIPEEWLRTVPIFNEILEGLSL